MKEIQMIDDIALTMRSKARSLLTSPILPCRNPEINLCHGKSEIPPKPGTGNKLTDLPDCWTEMFNSTWAFPR